MPSVHTVVPLLVVLWCLFPSGAAQAQAREGGVAVQPWEGQRLAFCTAPELSVVLKVDSATVGARQFSMGTGTLAPRTSNSSRGHQHDEIIYFVRGLGQATIGSDTVAVHSGTTLYLPRGLRHAFINPTDEALEFVWVAAPRGFEDGLRERGVPPGTPCPPPGPR